MYCDAHRKVNQNQANLERNQAAMGDVDPVTAELEQARANAQA